MSEDQFKDFFFAVLKTQIPPKERTEILAYWKRFGAKPTFFLSDANIRAQAGNDKVEIAAVWPVEHGWSLSSFAFRPFLFTEGSEHVIRTVVQHELIHCHLHHTDSPDRALRLLRNPDRPTNPFEIDIAKVKRGLLVYREEPVVIRINTSWGGDEKEASAWCHNFIAEHGINQYA